MAVATVYQCFNFLARNNGVISLARNPDDPGQNRCVIKVGEGDDEVLAACAYPCTEEFDLFGKLVRPVCNALQEQVE